MCVNCKKKKQIEINIKGRLEICCCCCCIDLCCCCSLAVIAILHVRQSMEGHAFSLCCFLFCFVEYCFVAFKSSFDLEQTNQYNHSKYRSVPPRHDNTFHENRTKTTTQTHVGTKPLKFGNYDLKFGIFLLQNVHEKKNIK